MNRFRPAGSQLLVILTGILAIAVPAARAGLLETTIDLNYTYEQTHLGDDITSGTSVEQQYTIEYEAAATRLFDMLAIITLDLQSTSADQEADNSRIGPSLELTFTAPKSLIRLNYDAAIDRTDEFRDSSASETYSTSYVLEMEVTPDYWPETNVKFERNRDFEDQATEAVEKIFTLDLRKQIGDLSLEFDYEYQKLDDVLPSAQQKKSTAWGAQVAYQSTVWWDVDVDLTYEIGEVYTEEFIQGKFAQEEQDYAHNIQARLKKSLVLTPRLQADLYYSYEFEQDLLFLEMDYGLLNEFGLSLTYDMFSSLELTADFERSIEKTINIRPQDDDEEVEDFVNVGFSYDPVRWFRVIGQAEWTAEQSIESGTGATLNQEEEAAYELSARHRWGSWWILTASSSSEYEYIDNWLTKEESQFVVDVAIAAFDGFLLEGRYDIQRLTTWEERSPLELSQSKREEAGIRFDFERDFSDMIMFSFAHEFAINWETEIDEVMSEDELVELTEDTQIRLVLADFIRDFILEGDITRKATDTKDDGEPMLVDISYVLRLEWLVDDVNVTASYQYDDNGDTFDASSLNSEIKWSRDTFEVSGEYQFDKIYSDEIEEQRRLNLNMSMLF
jgi:predicted porin